VGRCVFIVLSGLPAIEVRDKLDAVSLAQRRCAHDVVYFQKPGCVILIGSTRALAVWAHGRSGEDTQRTKAVLLEYLYLMTGKKLSSVEEYSKCDFRNRRLKDNWQAASLFSDYVFDVWRAGWHDISDPCVDILLMINLCLHENGQDVVTTESQCVRMLRPSSASKKVTEFLGRANSHKPVSKHQTKGIVPTQSPKTIKGVDSTQGKPEPPVRDASCWPEWIVPPSPENKSGQPTLGIWMFDAAQCGPTTSLSAYQLLQLASSSKFSSVVLFGRKLSAECDHDPLDGPVKMLRNGSTDVENTEAVVMPVCTGRWTRQADRKQGS
jgi:hypothetical protein